MINIVVVSNFLFYSKCIMKRIKKEFSDVNYAAKINNQVLNIIFLWYFIEFMTHDL